MSDDLINHAHILRVISASYPLTAEDHRALRLAADRLEQLEARLDRDALVGNTIEAALLFADRNINYAAAERIVDHILGEDITHE